MVRGSDGLSADVMLPLASLCADGILPRDQAETAEPGRWAPLLSPSLLPSQNQGDSMPPFLVHLLSLSPFFDLVLLDAQEVPTGSPPLIHLVHC